jgi:hypothetical protein
MRSYRKRLPYQRYAGNASNFAAYVSVKPIHRTDKHRLLLAGQSGEFHKATVVGGKVFASLNVERKDVLRCLRWLSLNKKLKFTTTTTNHHH